jgi:hypothetical protein
MDFTRYGVLIQNIRGTLDILAALCLPAGRKLKYDDIGKSE